MFKGFIISEEEYQRGCDMWHPDFYLFLRKGDIVCRHPDIISGGFWEYFKRVPLKINRLEGTILKVDAPEGQTHFLSSHVELIARNFILIRSAKEQSKQFRSGFQRFQRSLTNAS